MGQNTRENARTPGSAAVAVVTGADEHREYSDSERTVTVMLATLVGVAEAAKQRDVPASTIYTWLAKCGGAEALRTAANDVLATTEFAVAIDACLEIRRRLSDMSDKALIDALRLLGSAGARSPNEKSGGDVAHGPPPLIVQFNNGTDRPDEITVPPEPRGRPEQTSHLDPRRSSPI